MKKILAILFIMLFAALPVCAKKRQAEEIITPMTQLQKRAFQVRTYKNDDKVVVMKSVLNVLQDEGYIVYNVNSLLGFIYAVKDFDTSDRNIDIAKEFGFSKSRLTYNGVKVATLESCINVTEYGNTVRTRVNFERKLLNEYGNAQFIDDVEEEQFYQDFYAKVDREIEIQKQLNSSIKPINLKKAPAPKVIIDKPVIKNTKKEKIAEPEEKTIDNIEEDSPTVEKEFIKEDAPDAEKKEEIKTEIKQEEVQKLPEEQAEKSQKELKAAAKEAKKQAKADKKAQKEQLKEMKKLEKYQAKEDKKAQKQQLKEMKKQAKEAKKAKDKE